MFFLCMLQNLLCITLVPRLISKREATPKKMLKSQVKKAKLESPAGLLLGKITTKNVGSHLSLVLYYFIACYKKILWSEIHEVTEEFSQSSFQPM